MQWQKTTKSLQYFNGCMQTVIVGDKELGVFKERYSCQGMKWRIRSRPMKDGKVIDSWSVGTPFYTKKEAVTFVENKLVREKV